MKTIAFLNGKLINSLFSFENEELYCVKRHKHDILMSNDPRILTLFYINNGKIIKRINFELKYGNVFVDNSRIDFLSKSEEYYMLEVFL